MVSGSDRTVVGGVRLRAAASDVDGSAEGQTLARALRVAAKARPDRDARERFARIEARRRDLLADRSPLSASQGQTLTVREVTKRASSPSHQAWLLYALARELGARRCLEMGTCVGISGSYLAAAVDDRGGALRTLEGHGDRAEVARATFTELGFQDAEVVVGSFSRTLDRVLADEDPFDLVFVDGHHDGDATRSYVTRIREASPAGTLLVLDDIAWSDGMAAAWRDLSAELRGSVRVDLGRLGLIAARPRGRGRHLTPSQAALDRPVGQRVRRLGEPQTDDVGPPQQFGEARTLLETFLKLLSGRDRLAGGGSELQAAGVRAVQHRSRHRPRRTPGPCDPRRRRRALPDRTDPRLCR